ncbi:MAG: MarR family winged helix-turn-helix transcriptional regulator [Ilumatobacteraceae bacterium]
MPQTPHPTRRIRPDASFIGRPLRDVWGHFNSELIAGVTARYPDATAATNEVMLLIDGDGTTVSELARRAGVTKQAMAETVQALEARRFVIRHPSPSDRRARLVILTDDGWAAMRVGLEIVTEMHDRWSDLLGHSKMAQLVNLLEQLAERLDKASS